MKKRIKYLTGLIPVFMTAVSILTTDMVKAAAPYTGPYDQYYTEREIICPARTPGDDSNPEYDLDYTSGTYNYGFTMFFTSEGYRRITSDYFRVFPREAETIFYGTPVIKVCDNCKGRYNDSEVYSARIFVLDDSGREVISRPGTFLGRSDVASINLEAPVRIGLELTIDPKELCPVCNKHIGDIISIQGLFYTKKILEIASHPESVTVDPGQSASFAASLSKYRGTYGGPMNYYRWMIYRDGVWRELSNGVAPGGEVYSGVDTLRLSVSNVRSDMSGVKYACAFKGINDTLWKTRSATLTVKSPPVTPVVTPTPAVTPTPTVTPTPAVTVTPSPTGTVIRPGGGGNTQYNPASSSSTFRPTTTPSSSSNKPQQTSSTGHVKNSSSEYNGTINPGGGPGNTSLPADDPLPQMINNGGSANVKPGRGSSSSADRNSSSSQSSTARKGSSTIMKNGVLYIVDDDTGSIGTGPGIEDTKEPEIEEVESDEAYTAANLAGSRELMEQTIDKGFFGTPYGYIVIALIALLVLLLALFFLFFGVIVLGEAEEHDEVFEICALRIMKRHEGKWCVNLGTAFDDNAVLKLRIGLLFAVIFDGWDMTGEVYGMYEGEIKADVEQGMLLYRKNIRRSL